MNAKERKNIIELARTMSPSTIARLSSISLEDVTDVLGSDETGAPRNGAMSTMKFTSGMNMVPEGYPRDEIKDPLRINRDTTSQGIDEYETSEDRGNPFLTATGTQQFNPHAVGTSQSMVVDPRANMMNPQQQLYQNIGTPYEMPTTPSGGAAMYPMDAPMNPQQFTQEDMMQQERGLMNPNVPRQGFDPYMDWRNRR